MSKEQLSNAISQLISKSNKRVLLVIGEDNHFIFNSIIEILQKISKQPLIINLAEVTNIEQHICYLPKDQPGILLFTGIAANGRLENLYNKYSLDRWQAPAVFICPKSILHPTLDPSIYYAPIKNNRIQKQLFAKIELARQNPKEATLALLEPREPLQTSNEDIESKVMNPLQHFLNKKLLTNDLVMMQMLADRVIADEKFKTKLFEMVYLSRNQAFSNTGANAITVLNHAKAILSGKDFSYLHLAGADLSNAVLHGSKFIGADLHDVKFTNAYLAEADFSDSNMADVYFGQLPYFKFEQKIQCIAYSPDGLLFAAGVEKSVYLHAVTTGKQLQILHGHKGYIRCLAFSKDSKLLASGDEDKSIRVWAVANGQQKYFLRGHRKRVTSVAITNDCKTLISTSLDGSVRLWQLETGRLLEVWQVSDKDYLQLWSVVISKSDKLFAVSGDACTLYICELENLKRRKQLHGSDYVGDVFAIAITNDEKMLVSVSRGGTVRFWHIESGEELKVIVGHYNIADSIAISNDGKFVVTGGTDNCARVWDTASKEQIQILPSYKSFGNGVAIAPNNQTIATISQETVYFWQFDNVSALRQLPGHASDVTGIAFNHDETQLVSGSHDHTVRLWNADTGNELRTMLGHTNSVNSVVWNYDNKLIASAGFDVKVNLWNAETGQLINTLTSHKNTVYGMASSQNEDILVTGSSDKTVRFWRSKTGEEIHALLNDVDVILSVAISDDNKSVVLGCHDNHIRLWRAERSEELQVLKGHSYSVKSVAISRSGKIIASGSRDSSIRLWSIESGETLSVLKDHTDDVNCVAISSDNKMLASGSIDKTIRVWDISNPTDVKCIYIFPNGSSVLSLRFNKSNNIIVSADGPPNNSIRLWRLFNNNWYLQWATPQRSLHMSGCVFKGAKNLSSNNSRLIEQLATEITLIDRPPFNSTASDNPSSFWKTNQKASSLNLEASRVTSTLQNRSSLSRDYPFQG